MLNENVSKSKLAMIKHFFFVGWFFISLPAVLAQSPELNAEKYWQYRERLLNEFMVSSEGNESGTNIPASIRHKGRGQMRWGDATINLSNYMAMLATEYSVLKQQGLPVHETLQELHRALLAMERLDAKAPAFYELDASEAYTYPKTIPPSDTIPSEITPSDTILIDTISFEIIPSEIILTSEYALDGFFIRDDVPEDFTRQWSATHPALAGFPHVRSDYTDPDIRLNEMSQDQVWNLIIGLALVSHLVDDTSLWHIPEYHGHTLLSLGDRASMAAYRMIRAMQAEICLQPFDFWDRRWCVRYWHLYNPYLGQSVKRGSVPNLLKYGFAEAGNAITGYQYGNMHWSNSGNARIWFNVAGALQYLQRLRREKNVENIYHIATTATVGAVWNTAELVRLFNRHRKLFFRPDYQYEHLALISCVLHGDCPKILQKEEAYYRELLNSAPMHGPFNYGNDAPQEQGAMMHYQHGDEYHHEWSSVNRFVWPHRRGSGTIEAHKGEYNGLDYMMLYNLFYLVYGQTE
jgi:hypothetical protein